MNDYERSLEMTASFSRKEYKMLCPICGRYYDKWFWRTPCCAAEIVYEEVKESEGNADGKEEAT